MRRVLRSRDCAGEVCGIERGLGRACKWHPVPRSTIRGCWCSPKAATDFRRTSSGMRACHVRAVGGQTTGAGGETAIQRVWELKWESLQAQQMLMQNRECCVRALRCDCSLQSARKRLPDAPVLAGDGACMACQHVYFNLCCLEALLVSCAYSLT